MSVPPPHAMFAALCTAVAIGCLRPADPPPAPPPPAPPPAAPPIPAPAPTAPAPAAAPLDDPRSCIDPPAERQEAGPDVYAETHRRVLELSDQIRACRGSLQGEIQSIVEVDVGADGATRARVTATSLSECAAVSCIRDKLTALQIIAPPLNDTRSFEWLLAIGDQGPVRLEVSREYHPAPAKSPESSAACLDASSYVRNDPGRLPPEEIRRIVRANYGTYRKCYEAGLGRYAKLEGKVTLRFVIERDGTVSNAVVSDSTLPDCQVARCVRDGFKTLRFPKPRGGGIVTVQYPIMLQPG